MAILPLDILGTIDYNITVIKREQNRWKEISSKGTGHNKRGPLTQKYKINYMKEVITMTNNELTAKIAELKELEAMQDELKTMSILCVCFCNSIRQNKNIVNRKSI